MFAFIQCCDDIHTFTTQTLSHDHTPCTQWRPSVLKALQASVNEDDKSGKGDCGLLVVAVGQQAGTFAHAMLGEGGGALEPAGYLLLGEEPLGPCSLSHGPHSPHGMLYRCTSPDSKKEVLLMWCAQKVSEERAFAWTQTLFAHVEPESVVVLSSLPSSSYTKGDLDESAHPPVLRMVETSLARKNRQTQQNKDEDNECAYLQPPNLCTGLPAAILSHCEVHGLSAQLYLSVTEYVCVHMCVCVCVHACASVRARRPSILSNLVTSCPSRSQQILPRSQH